MGIKMHEDDFFGVEGENLDALKLIDRIPDRSRIIVPFSDEEQEFVTMTADAETFDEAVAVAEKIWELAKEQQKEDGAVGKCSSVWWRWWF